MLRKKRVTISAQAQAAIATGMPVDQALAEHGAPAAEPAASDPPAEPTAETPAVEPTAETPAVEPAAVDSVPDGTVVDPAAATPTEPVPAAVAPDQATMSALLDRMQDAQSTVATQASQITQLEADATQTASTHEALMGIAIEAVNRWEIGLGGVATDLSGLSAENLLAKYQSTLALMNTRYPVGGKAEVLVDDGSHDSTVVPLVTPAVARATQIRK